MDVRRETMSVLSALRGAQGFDKGAQRLGCLQSCSAHVSGCPYALLVMRSAVSWVCLRAATCLSSHHCIRVSVNPIASEL